MGRTKGSKNKPKATVEYENNEEAVNWPEGVEELPKLVNSKRALAIDAEKFNVPPFPSNWNEMGKVDRLKWLTEHKR